jgi:hypothetical protein
MTYCCCYYYYYYYYYTGRGGGGDDTGIDTYKNEDNNCVYFPECYMLVNNL